MKIFVLAQHFMGISLTAGFIIHDIHFTSALAGINYLSVVFLISLLWFHVLIYFKEARLITFHEKNAHIIIRNLRILVIMLIFTAIVSEHFSFSADQNIWANIMANLKNDCIHIVLFLVPEYIFKLIFSFTT